MKTVLIIGPAPTRIGGVSTHITRLAWLLKDNYHFDYIDEARGKVAGYYNCRSIHFMTYLKKMKKADMVHIHSAVFILRFFHIIVAKLIFRKPVCVSIHHDLRVEGFIGITKRLLKICDCAVLDSQQIYDSIYESKVKCSYKMMPAFLPPIEELEDELPEEIVTWIQNVRSDSSAVLMCSSSSNINDYNGVDLYGNDMSIDSVRLLNERNNGKTFYLLMIIHRSENNPARLKEYQEKIAKESNDNIFLITKPASFVRIMKLSDVVLRPTNTDGDSITIREALFYGKATVASDCVERPEGTYVFKTRDLQDYCDKIVQSIDGNREIVRIPVDYKAFYINCYEKNSSSRK